MLVSRARYMSYLHVSSFLRLHSPQITTSSLRMSSQTTPKQQEQKQQIQIGVLGDFFLDIHTSISKLPEWNEDNLVPSISFIPGDN